MAMKSTSAFPLVALVFVSNSFAQPVQQVVPPDQAADGVYRVIERGPHHRTWQRLTQELDENGFLAEPRINAYVELASGLHAWAQDKQEWVEASDEIEILEDGAVARKSQHQVAFSGNLADANGTIDLHAPDGQRFRSRVVGLAYTEAGKSVFIAEIKDTQGFVLGRNQVLYFS